MAACGSKPTAIAELTRADGTVERQRGLAGWSMAFLGTQYFLGDAARTGQDTAELKVGGSARIVMQGNTTLRFGGTPGQARITVEGGAIDLSGTGSYSFDVGDVTLSHSTVRIRSNDHRGSSIELRLGDDARFAPRNGQSFDLEIGVPRQVGGDPAPPIDAGVPDAPAIDLAADAAAQDEPVAGAAIEITGPRAELLSPGATGWRPLVAGAARLAPGSAVRLGTGTTARLTAGATVLELAGGARARLDQALGVALEAGAARVSATEPSSVAIPGGALGLAGAPGAPADAKLETAAPGTKVAMQRGSATLSGSGSAELAISRGETALLTRAGAIRVIEAIPGYFDLRVVAGESFQIHDPRPPTAVRFQFDGRCPGGGIIELDRDPGFRAAKVSGGRDAANALVRPGVQLYRLRCTSNGGEGGAVASGRIAVFRDDGRRPLPRTQGVNDIDADGRNYTISYQSAIPNVRIRVGELGPLHRLHLVSAGKDQTFESTTPSVVVPGGQLHEGSYSYWVERDGVRQGKLSTLTIDFDQTSPQVYVESPIDGRPWPGDIDVRGAVLPGWTAAVDAVTIPVDPQRRFAAKVGIPVGNALAIRLSHPQRGVHYYLRRQK